jgi:PAS domain S-box-containing protein
MDPQSSGNDRWFQNLLEAAPDAMVIMDQGGRISLINSQAEALFGYSPTELLGHPLELLVPERSRDSHQTHRNRFVANPHRRPMGSGLELSGRRKDGSEFPVEISLSPVATGEGIVVAAAVRDISDRLQRNHELAAVNRELEAFTYSVSHDLRAPLRQILGFVRLLEQEGGEDISSAVRHCVVRIRDCAEHMGRLVEDLLKLAQLGRQSPHPRPVALLDLVSVAMLTLEGELANREIEWRIGSLPTVACDPGLMTVVFTNLLSNAIKYTRPRRPAVIEVGQTSRNGHPVLLVRDNGVGFDMKYADRLFGVFQRLHNAEEFEGTGVGLAIVQRIIRNHGGEVWAEAEAGRGATFFFTLGRPGPG